jgi:hypothetical protein
MKKKPIENTIRLDLQFAKGAITEAQAATNRRAMLECVRVARGLLAKVAEKLEALK